MAAEFASSVGSFVLTYVEPSKQGAAMNDLCRVFAPFVPTCIMSGLASPASLGVMPHVVLPSQTVPVKVNKRKQPNRPICEGFKKKGEKCCSPCTYRIPRKNGVYGLPIKDPKLVLPEGIEAHFFCRHHLPAATVQLPEILAAEQASEAAKVSAQVAQAVAVAAVVAQQAAAAPVAEVAAPVAEAPAPEVAASVAEVAAPEVPAPAPVAEVAAPEVPAAPKPKPKAKAAAKRPRKAAPVVEPATVSVA